MIVPNFHTNFDGDIIFSFTNVSESKKEQFKKFYDKKKYLSEVVLNPIGDEVISNTCECEGFVFRGDCKHIKQNLKLIKELCIKK